MTAILSPDTTPVPSADKRWTYSDHAEFVRVTHTASGLPRDYYGTTLTQVVSGHIPAGRLEADFRDLVAHLLNHPSARPDDRVAATTAAISLSMVDSVCVCGGYLTYTTGRRLAHLDLCRWCVDDAGSCPLGHEVRRMCATPAPVQCGHAQCHSASRHDETRACGADLDCCGRHGCDTALPA